MNDKYQNPAKKNSTTKPYKRDIETAQPFKFAPDEKYVTGTYFEIAMYNFCKTIKELLNRAEIKTLGKTHINNLSDENIGQALTDLCNEKLKLTPTQLTTFANLLYRYLPFLKPLMADFAAQNVRKAKKAKLKNKYAEENIEETTLGISESKILEPLAVIGQTLLYYRNLYSHKNPYNNTNDEEKQTQRESNIAQWLEILFLAERNIIIERNAHEKKDTNFLTRDGSLNYNINRNRKSVRNYKFYFSPGLKDNKEWQLTDFGRFYFCSLFLRNPDAECFASDTKLFEESPFKLTEEKKSELQSKEDKRAADEQSRITEMGYTHTVNPRKIEGTESAENTIIREMLRMHRMRIPREKRIDADLNEGTLLMDILNELCRCPDELYNTFCPEQKAEFQRIGESPDGLITENTLTRTKDRFAHLALRCIDQLEIFRQIRFHLRLGLYKYRFYHKTGVDGNPIEPIRTIHKEVNGFGRWQEVESLRKSKWQTIFQERTTNDDGLEQLVPDNDETKPYITDSRTSYNIHANRIGMSWGKNIKNGLYMPDLNVDNGNNKTRKALIDMPSPMCYISIYDLPALLFYQYLYDKYQGGRYDLQNVEKTITNKYDALKDVIVAIQNGGTTEDVLKKMNAKGLMLSELPEKIQNHINGKPIDGNKYRHAINVLTAVVEEAKKRQESFNHKQERIEAGGRNNRYGRRGYADIKHGELARYLTKSMMRWQPELNKPNGGKLTPANIQALANFLTEYEASKNTESLIQVLKSANLVGGRNPHPFLEEKVLAHNPSNIEKLYTTYLDAEISHAEYLLNKITTIEPHALPPFIRKGIKNNEETITQTAKRYLKIPATKWSDKTNDNPLMLPDGLFTKPLSELICRAAEKNDELKPMKSMIESSKNPLGAAYLIRYWFDQVEGDSSQKFYGETYKRFYRPISLLQPNRQRNRELIPDYLTETEIAEKLKLTRKKNRNELMEVVGKSYNLKTQEEVAEKSNKMLGILSEVSDNEQKIRRYRIQDITLFLTFRNMLANALSNKDKGQIKNNTLEKINRLHLHDFGSIDTLGCIEAPEHYKYYYTIKDEENKELNGNTIEIIMPHMSLRNYGTIFRVIDDPRINNLMKCYAVLGITSVTFNDITNELAQYNRTRKLIMKRSQQIEQEAYDGKSPDENGAMIPNQTFLEDPEKDRFYRFDKNTGKSSDARRNHFGSLMQLLENYNDLAHLLNEIRNAVAHNRYPNTTVCVKLKDSISDKATKPSVIITAIEEMIKQQVSNMPK